MPFQSEKQRRYLHANHPEIANRWEAKYGLGGIAELNSQLNSLPEYYLPKNQGGLIPSHEAGIYGLAEGGRTDYIHGGITHPGGRRGFPGGSGRPGDRPMPEGGSGADYGGPPGGGDSQMTYTAPHVPHYKEEEETKKFAIQEDIRRREEEKGGEEYYGQREIQNQQEILSKKTQDYILKNLQKLDPNKYYKDMGIIQKAIEMGQSIPTPTVFGILKALYNENKLTSEGNALLEEWSPFIGGAPGTNPQAYDELWLALEKRKGKYKYDGDEDTGGDGVTGVASITYDDEDQEALAYKASADANRILEDARNAKRDAYLAAFRQKYLMGDTEEPQTMFVAQGGRIPGGYNTGGLSNLFRLKNR